MQIKSSPILYFLTLNIVCNLVGFFCLFGFFPQMKQYVSLAKWCVNHEPGEQPAPCGCMGGLRWCRLRDAWVVELSLCDLHHAEI